MDHHQVENSEATLQEKMFQSGLENIRSDFRRSLSAKLSEIERLMGLIETNNGGEKALIRLSESAHKFRGAATTLGFNELGDAAGDLEDCISDIGNPKKDSIETAELFLRCYRRLTHEISSLL